LITYSGSDINCDGRCCEHEDDPMALTSPYQDICRALATAGLSPRGGFEVQAADSVPPLADGRPARTVLLAGNAGPAMWKAFSRTEHHQPDPLDRWSRSILETIATCHDAGVVMPSDGPPFAPFQRWAMRAEPVYPSPLGILIHPRWGLWHGYRGALVFAKALSLPRREALENPCESCAERPCLTPCPVEAFARSQYRVDACAEHLQGPNSADCRIAGCLARRACPVGRDARYGPEQSSFHMASFLATGGV
jgi:hypothetical protein